MSESVSLWKLLLITEKKEKKKKTFIRLIKKKILMLPEGQRSIITLIISCFNRRISAYSDALGEQLSFDKCNPVSL